MERLRLLDLFSGIGGFSLGLEASGHFETVAFCEINPKPHRVLRAHWPEVPIYDDINTLSAERLRSDSIVVDAICGGFPCQDVSSAGPGSGLDGTRSGLWFEYLRLIRELRPKLVFVENVSSLLARGLDRVLGSLAAIGYDAEWHCIPAGYVGLPHERDRIWIVAYPAGSRWSRHAPHRILIESVCAKIARSSDVIADARSTLEGNPGDLCSGHGISFKLAREAIVGYGNAVTPLIPEALGRVYGPAA